MKRILIEETKNGYIVRVQGFMKVDGPYVYKATEYIEMLEFIGEQIYGGKMKVERR